MQQSQSDGQNEIEALRQEAEILKAQIRDARKAVCDTSLSQV